MPAITMDVFKQDAFSTQNLTTAIDRAGYVPQTLGSIPGLFVPPPLGQPINKAIFVEERDNEPVLIQTTPHGAEPSMGRTDEKTRKVTPFAIPRLFRSRRIVPAELAGIREFGSITVEQQLDSMVARKQLLIKNDIELTKENMRLGAVQGIVKDADNSTIYDYTSVFNQSSINSGTWTLSASVDDGTTRSLCSTTRRSMIRALKGLGGTGVKIFGLCSDGFWDKFMASLEVRHTWQFAMQATVLQQDAAWQSFDYGGITFMNYRGTDDNSTVAVGSGLVKFFPAGAGIFQEVYAPADDLGFEYINTPGQPIYSWLRVDPLRNAWADVEVASYPLFMCVQPSALAHGTV